MSLRQESARLKSDVKAQSDDERFDIVDHLDRVVGQAARAKVHASQLWHRAVHVLVFDPTGRVLLQLRAAGKDTSPGRWDSACSGHLDAGETYDAAAARELGEELGLTAEPRPVPQRWRKLEACAQTGLEFVWIYWLEHRGPFRPAPAEIDRVEWWQPSRVTRALKIRPEEFTPAFRYLWRELALDEEA